jgi:Ca2+-binding RTX toxin-like protein
LAEWKAADGSPLLLTATNPWHYADLESGIEIESSDIASEFPLDEKTSYLFGSSQPDILVGGGQSDALHGADGDDVLDGGGGADYLEGGRGIDTYRAGNGDTVFDHDGEGHIFFDGALLFGGERRQGEAAYVDASGDYRYKQNGQDLEVIRVSDNAVLTIEGFEVSHFGIKLKELPPLPQPFRPLSTGSTDSEYIEGKHEVASDSTDWDSPDTYNKPDHILGGDGRDWIYAWSRPYLDDNGNYLGSAPDNDIVEGGVGKDFIHGGAGDDILYATTELDSEAVRNGFGSPLFDGVLAEEGDFVTAESGNDSVYGSGGLDGLFGGEGNDYLYAGDGNDYIYGDWQAYLPYEHLAITDYDYQWITIDDEGNVTTFVDYVSGIGDDHIYAGNGDDRAWGEAGDDIIFGGEGNDQLDGDIARVNGDGLPTVPPSAHGTDRLHGERGEDTLIGNGGNDYLFGGDDNDWLEGDSRLVRPGDLAFHGDDLLHGGAGSDTLIGLGGVDTLFGGTGNDFLYGDAAELDTSYHGVDALHGGDGDDQLVGFGGNDLLFGGNGSDHYEFSPGDGLDSIVDGDGGAQGDSLHFVGTGGIGAVTFSLQDGDLYAKIGAEGFVFHDWDVNEFGGVYYYDSEGAFIEGRSASDVLAAANVAPTVAAATSNEQFSEDRLVTVSLQRVGFADANGGSLSFSATLSDGSPLPAWLNFNADALLLSGVPDNDAVGRYSVRVTADDGYGGSASHTLSLQIDNINDAPELVAPLPSRSMTAGFDFEHDLSGYFNEVDEGDTLSVLVSLSNGDPLPTWVTFEPSSMVLAGAAPEDFTNDLAIRAVAIDEAGAETAAGYTISFHAAADSLQTSLLTRDDLSVPDIAGYYPFYLDRDFFEWQNGLIGDINGDGYDDYYFGTDTPGHAFWRERFTNFDGTPILDSTAVVQIIYGDADGWSDAAVRSTSFTLGSDSAFDQLGLPDLGIGEALLDAYRLTPLGDANSDGFDDFALGDRVFWGTLQGFDETYVWEDIARRPLLSPADQPDFSGEVLNLTVTTAGVAQTLQAKNVGDVNGDGLDDYVTPIDASTYGSSIDAPFAEAGAPQQKPLDSYAIDDADPVGSLHVLYGQAGGLGGAIDLDQLDPSQGYRIQGFTQFVETRDYFGTPYDVNRVSYNPLVSGGDIDGDGLTDIMISTVAGFANSEPVNLRHDEYSVRNYILFGSSDPVNGIDLIAMSPDQGLTQEYLPNTTDYGHELVPGLIELRGDVNGDGFDDAVAVTGDYREADYGGRVDLRVLYGSDLRNSALFQGDGSEDDQVVVKKQGSVYTLGGNDEVFIRPNAGPYRYDINTGPGDDTVDLLIPDNSGLTGGTSAHLNGGDGSDIYRVRGGSALPASGVRLPRNNVYIDDRSSYGSSRGSNSLVVGFGASGGSLVSIPTLEFGSLKLTFAELDLAIHLENFDKDNVLEGPRDIDIFDLGDGQILTYEELVANGFDLTGTDSADVIEGSSVADRIAGLAGADTLSGGRGDDTLDGGPGVDRLFGGAGADTYVFALGDALVAQGMTIIDDVDGASRIRFGPGIQPDDVQVQDVRGDLLVRYSAQDSFLVLDGARAGQLLDYRFGSVLVAASEFVNDGREANQAPFASADLPAITVQEGRPRSVQLSPDLFDDPDGDRLAWRIVLDGSDALPGWIGFDAEDLRLDVRPGDDNSGDYMVRVSASDPQGESATALLPLSSRP